MTTRRRFLSIAAAALCARPAVAATARWRGVVMGAEASIELTGDGAEAALAEVLALVREVEATFSLYDPASEISRLNRDGRLADPSVMMREVVNLSDRAHRATGGTFDPTVQALWLGRGRVGWTEVSLGDALRLGTDQALTFNGIAQGYATDCAADALERRGFGRALVTIGEHRGIGGPWRLGLADPDLGDLGTRTLVDGAIATSSPAALRLPGGGTHIMHPGGRLPLWSTVSVEADRATTADALSTAACLMNEDAIRAAMAAQPGIRRVTLVDGDGRLRTMTG